MTTNSIENGAAPTSLLDERWLYSINWVFIRSASLTTAGRMTGPVAADVISRLCNIHTMLIHLVFSWQRRADYYTDSSFLPASRRKDEST